MAEEMEDLDPLAGLDNVFDADNDNDNDIGGDARAEDATQIVRVDMPQRSSAAVCAAPARAVRRGGTPA